MTSRLSSHRAEEALREVTIFSTLDVEEIAELRRILHEEPVAAGQELFRQGDVGEELYVVKSGSVGSSIALDDGSQREIAVFHAGDFFGEMSIFERAPRSATCYAKEDSIVLRLPAPEFFHFIKDNSAAAIKIMYRMLTITSRRLENTGEFLSGMVTWGEEARKRAITDEFTGVYNRRFLDDAIEEEFSRARQQGASLSLLMVDLDRFREINETFGKETGDTVLLEAVGVFRRHLRDNDVIARYGGDEFTVLLPNTTVDEAHRMASAICKAMARSDILRRAGGGPSERVTVSQGVAAYPETAGDLKGLRAAADAALYRAKEAGKNCARRAPRRESERDDRRS